jgi:hypothetical protein
MTTYAESYPGKYLTAADLPDHPVEVVISEFVPKNTEKAEDGRLIPKPILRFRKAEKALICNVTNMRRILLFYATKTGQLEDLVGVKITLTKEKAMNPAMGCIAPAVRVAIPKGGK